MPKSTDTLLIIGQVWPEPRSSASGRRMMELIDLFQSEHWEVIFASPSVESEFSTDLKSRDISTMPVEINDSGFDDVIRQLCPTAVLFDRFVLEEQFGWRVASNCPDTLRILDTEDLHCLRRSRRQALEEQRTWYREDLLTDETAMREIAGMYRSDLSLVISEYEMQLLTDLFRVDTGLIQYVPYLRPPVDDSAKTRWPEYASRQHFVTVGNFRHGPNHDAVRYLEKEIWPLIRKKLPQAHMHVYGAYPTKEIGSLNRPEDGFFIKGRTEDARAVVRQARVCLAPLRYGAGLKGKLVEAMECGTPAVTTGIGAEGLAGELEFGGFIADDPGAFADAAVQLYTDKAIWLEKQENGVQIINRRFSGKKLGPKLLERIHDTIETLDDHRQRNFTGAMLRHHTMASTKYMSRWIEEKNRKN